MAESTDIEAFDPTFAKILVRYNIDGSKADNARSIERLTALNPGDPVEVGLRLRWARESTSPSEQLDAIA